MLTATFVTISVVNYQQNVSNVYSALDSAISRAGEGQNAGPGAGEGQNSGAGENQAGEGSIPPALPNEGDTTATDRGQTATDAGTSLEGMVSNLGPQVQGNTDLTPPEIGGKDGESSTPVAVFTIDEGGNWTVNSKATTASLSDDTLAAAKSELDTTTDGQGSLDSANLYYLKKTLGNNISYVAFADKSTVSSWQTLAVTLGVTEVAALAVFFIISVLFARWAVRPVEKAWAQQRQFIADASHELKTPLTVILANSSILKKHPEKTIAQENDLIESTEIEAKRMQELVCDMLDLEKTGQKNEVLEQLNFSELVESKALQFDAVAFEKHVYIETEVEPGVVVKGNETRLNRLVSILLDNACKYSTKNEAVTVALKKQGEKAILTVNNKGPAISEEDLEHIFDRFYRADKARSAESGSYGLGLSIAQQIAFDHSGTLTCDSTAAEGTTFTLTI